MADPPERNSSTSMPVCCLNSAEIFCACSIGVDVYQLTLPSALALATSTASCAFAGDSARNVAAHNASLSLSMSCPPDVDYRPGNVSPRKRGPGAATQCGASGPWVPACAGTRGSSMLASIDRFRLSEEAQQDVFDERVILLLQRSM